MLKSLLIFLAGSFVSYGAAKVGEHGMREAMWIEAFNHRSAVYTENILTRKSKWEWSDDYFAPKHKYPPMTFDSL